MLQKMANMILQGDCIGYYFSKGMFNLNTTENYQVKRKAFYSQFTNFFYDIEDLEYAIYDVMPIAKEQIEEIKYASNILWKIFTKVSKQFKKLNKEQLISLGIREEMIPFIDLDYLPQQSVLARFDFILSKSGELKAIELNGDTPFLIQETFEMNRHLCKEFGFKNPNDDKIVMKSLSAALFASLEYLKGKKSQPVIVITGKEEEEDYEEYCHVQFIKRNLPFEVKYVPISELKIINESNQHIQKGLYTPDKQKIDVLYRPAHPIEFLIDDVSSDGDPIGIQLLELIKERELAIINSPAAYILQNKILMALIWAKKDDPLLYSPEEIQAINRYMLPTYLSEDVFITNKQPYVKKPVYSREGNTVEIYKGNGSKWYESSYTHYTDNLYVYQQYIEMPSIEIPLKEEVAEKKWLIGSFIADNEACGLSCRLGNAVTEWDSHWAAIGYK